MVSIAATIRERFADRAAGEPDRSRSRSAPRRRAALVLLLGALILAVSAPVTAQESPEGCNSSAVGVSLVPTLALTPIPPETCVIPGQEITYRTVPFVSPNPPPALGITYCDVVGGQLGVTFPDWRAAQDSGMLRPGQFVPVAGYASLPDVPQYGNGDPDVGASSPLPLFTVPEVYVVEAVHADAMGFLNARSDYGLTSFLNTLGLMQVNGTVLGNPAQQTANATITNALPLCVPEIELEKTPSQALVCEGEPTEITYTYLVTNVSTSPPAQPGAELPNLTNVVLVDDTCDVIEGPMNDDGDGVLNPGETWTYTCTTTVSTTTTNTAVVTANAQTIFPAGQTIDTVEYTDTAQATVTGTAPPTVSIDPPDAAICADGSQELCAVVAEGTPPYAYAWTGPGDFAADTECVTVTEAGEYCVTVTDSNGCSATACATLTVNEGPAVSIDPPAPAICEDSEQQMCAVVTGNGPFEYAWTGPGGFTAASECVTVSEAGEYCVTVTDANGCVGSACATLTVNENLQVSVSPPSAVICDIDTQGFCAVVNGGAPPFEYEWTGPGDFTADTSCITVGEAGEYCVTVTDANGCSGSACATLTVEICTAACCFADGSCEDLIEDECDSAGGEYQGDGTSCADVMCPQPYACCFNDGTCQELQPEQCLGAGGEPQDEGTTCADVECPIIKGACCLPLGGCAVVPAPNCDELGGVYQGDLTICVPLPCDPPSGACCLPDEACLDTNQDACEEAGGQWQGVGTACDEAMCFGSGACCFPDGSCEQRLQDLCVDAGGLYQGDGTNCVDVECVMTKGACCLLIGGCAVISQAECEADGGAYQGDLTTCVPFPCEEQALQGCSRLYWRDPIHHGVWPVTYGPETLFGDVFDDAFPGQTLQEVLDASGGGLAALGGQAVAALLSAASPGVDCGVSDAEIIAMFNAVYPEQPTEYASLKDYFKALSQQGCPLNGDAPDVPLPVTLGESAFDTIGAVTTELGMPDGCGMEGMTITNDVWRLFVADEPGEVVMSVCGSDFDTRIVVYDAQDGRGITCNDDACGAQSQASFTVETGGQYLIRIGGNDAYGLGMLEIAPVPTTCPADVNGDGLVDVDDLLAVIGQWGGCPTGCGADINQDGQVDVDDLTAVVLNWGACGG